MSEVLLYNSDCIQAMGGIADHSINLILTDPPYNLGNFMISRDTNLKKMRDKTNNNLMFKAQLEALLVAFELVWKVAKIRFSDGRPNSAERTGGSRFPKKVWFTLNMDLLDAVCGDDADYLKVFFSWLGFDLNADNEKERNIIRFLTIISESAYYKLIDNDADVVFNLESVYKAVLSHTDAVDNLFLCSWSVYAHLCESPPEQQNG